MHCRSGWWHVISMGFLRSFLRRPFSETNFRMNEELLSNQTNWLLHAMFKSFFGRPLLKFKGLNCSGMWVPSERYAGACTEFSQSPSGISVGEFLGKQREKNSTRRSSGRTVTERSCSVLSVCFCVLINFTNFSSVILRPWVLIQSLGWNSLALSKLWITGNSRSGSGCPNVG